MSTPKRFSQSRIPQTRAPRGGRRILRRIGAVLAGLVAIFAVTTVTDAVMHATGLFPPVGAPAHVQRAVPARVRVPFRVRRRGSYLTARLAPDRPMRHALVLGAIGLVLSIVGAVALWDAGPAWYPIALAASALPCAWLAPACTNTGAGVACGMSPRRRRSRSRAKSKAKARARRSQGPRG